MLDVYEMTIYFRSVPLDVFQLHTMDHVARIFTPIGAMDIAWSNCTNLYYCALYDLGQVYSFPESKIMHSLDVLFRQLGIEDACEIQTASTFVRGDAYWMSLFDMPEVPTIRIGYVQE